MITVEVKPYKIGPFADGYLTKYQVSIKVNNAVRSSTILDEFTMGNYRWLCAYARRQYGRG